MVEVMTVVTITEEVTTMVEEVTLVVEILVAETLVVEATFREISIMILFCLKRAVSNFILIAHIFF